MMGKYNLFDQTVEFSESKERFYDVYYAAIQSASQAARDFYSWYSERGDILSVLKNYENTALTLVSQYAIRPLFEGLVDLEIYDVSEDRYNENCLSLHPGNIIKQDRSCRAMMLDAVGLFVHRKLSGLSAEGMVISPATRR